MTSPSLQHSCSCLTSSRRPLHDPALSLNFSRASKAQRLSRCKGRLQAQAAAPDRPLGSITPQQGLRSRHTQHIPLAVSKAAPKELTLSAVPPCLLLQQSRTSGTVGSLGKHGQLPWQSPQQYIWLSSASLTHHLERIMPMSGMSMMTGQTRAFWNTSGESISTWGTTTAMSKRKPGSSPSGQAGIPSTSSRPNLISLMRCWHGRKQISLPPYWM